MTGTLLRDSKQKIRDVEGIYWSMALKLWDKLGGQLEKTEPSGCSHTGRLVKAWVLALPRECL